MDSALNGLKLVLRHQYVGLLFGISCLYEVVLTILDYQMKVRLGVSKRIRRELFRPIASPVSALGHALRTARVSALRRFLPALSPANGGSASALSLRGRLSVNSRGALTLGHRRRHSQVRNRERRRFKPNDLAGDKPAP